uniref:Protein SPEC3 n=1 Tax=Romanomermis culicivorax TaxID=13658 RepID=A0A915I214_ROMCU
MTTSAPEPPKIRVIKSIDVERKLAPRFAKKINKLAKETELQQNSANSLDVILSPSRRRWQIVKSYLPQIVEYGRKEGILAPKGREADQSNDKNDDQKQSKINEKNRQIDEDLIKITNEDVSAAHSAIPYLPVPLAIFCLILNVVLPGSGTIVSGLMVICVGQPRMLNEECRLFFAVFINFMVGLAQMCTITFFLVGWFWSIAWGGLMLTYSCEFK